jgi:primosomal protein N' (replication factor Y)
MLGVVITIDLQGYTGPTKEIVDTLAYKIPSTYIELIKFASSYNMISIGMIAKLVVPFSMQNILKSEKYLPQKELLIKNTTLSFEQKEALNKINNCVRKNKNPILIHGITGSGKTEVFLHYIAQRRSNESSQFLILVPEIALSNEVAKKVEERTGTETHIWHNSISIGKKLRIWKKAISGEKMAIVGARSALFVPLRCLATIVVDEEHDQSYKQNENPLYNARDMAVVLANLREIPIILSSATPSLESFYNSLSEKYNYIPMRNRFAEKAFLPKMEIIDMKKEKNLLSEHAKSEIQKRLDNNKQVLVFINKRGYALRILCSNCGKKILCPNCSTWLCFHAKENKLLCHYCNFKTELSKKCSSCGEDLISIGIGAEKCEEILKKLFQTSRIEEVSSDTLNTPVKIQNMIDKIKNRQVSIIVGTQIVSKGHNFPDLDLAILLNVDDFSYGDDFRARERAFQLISQVSGRVGRQQTKDSLIILQALDTNDDFLQMISKNEIFDEFYHKELELRKKTRMPPFCKLGAIIISSFNEKTLLAFAQKLREIAPKMDQIYLLGPIPAPIYKIKARYRVRFLVVSKGLVQHFISQWLKSVKTPNNIKLTIDIDPYYFQ